MGPQRLTGSEGLLWGQSSRTAGNKELDRPLKQESFHYVRAWGGETHLGSSRGLVGRQTAVTEVMFVPTRGL